MLWEFAELFAPADESAAWTIVAAEPNWSATPPSGPTVVIWGALPTTPDNRPRVLQWAIRRELALARLRLAPPGGLKLQRLHRLPPAGPLGGLRGLMRRSLLGGVIAELGRERQHSRTIDVVLSDAGAMHGSMPLVRPSRDGSATMRIEMPGDRVVGLRVARAGGSKDLMGTANALRLLATTGVQRVPRLLETGTSAGFTWTTETVLPGTPPPRLTPSLLDDVVDCQLQLQVDDGPITAIHDHLAHLAAWFPDLARPLDRLLLEIQPSLRRLPTVVQHGDLVLGNLLAERGSLTGIVDWETWHPAGTPGVDLLQLVASGGLGISGDIGTLWAARPWATPVYRRVASRYCDELRIVFDDSLVRLVVIGWWANRISVLMRRPERRGLAADPSWVEVNVRGILRSLWSDFGLEGQPA